MPEHSYHDEDISELIKWEMRKNSHYDKSNDKGYIELSANTNTLKSEMILKNNYEVNFGRYKFVNSLLWFHSKPNTWEFNESENMINILTINSILVNYYIISISCVNGSTQLTIYSFFPNVSPSIKLLKIHIIFFTFQ